MEICENLGDTILVYMPPELDDCEAEKMIGIIEKALARQTVKRVIFDFEKTTFMDSSGIGLITRNYRVMRDRGGQLAVMNTSERINKIFKMTGIYKIAQRLD
jgi:stage II sporulation protein AA (anti-sigma F factor antagonist)